MKILELLKKFIKPKKEANRICSKYITAETFESLYNTMTYKELSKTLGVPIRAIKETADTLGIKRKQGRLKRNIQIIQEAKKENNKTQYLYPQNQTYVDFCGKYELGYVDIDTDKALKLICLMQECIMKKQMTLNKPFIKINTEETITSVLAIFTYAIGELNVKNEIHEIFK